MVPNSNELLCLISYKITIRSTIWLVSTDTHQPKNGQKNILIINRNTSKGLKMKCCWFEGGGTIWQESTAAFKRGPVSHHLFPVPVTLYNYPFKLSVQFTSLHGHVAEQQYWFFFCFHFLTFLYSEPSLCWYPIFLFLSFLSSIRNSAFISVDKANFCVHTSSLRLPCIIGNFSCVDWFSSPTVK